MTCKADRHKPSTRPRKSESDKRRRLKVQKQRLMSLGMSESEVAPLTAQQVRDLLRRPAKIAAKS